MQILDGGSNMARMVVVYSKPKDVQAFERHYFEKHVPLAKKLPGIRKYEVSHGPIMSPFGPSEAYLIATLHFDDMSAIRAAFASESGQACAADRREFAPDTASFQTFLFDNKEV
jgi:uncharacterized protein (TIGR02118 family)